MDQTAEQLKAELEAVTQELEKKKAKGPGTNRGVETMFRAAYRVQMEPVSYTHLTLPTIILPCRSRWARDH